MNLNVIVYIIAIACSINCDHRANAFEGLNVQHWYGNTQCTGEEAGAISYTAGCFKRGTNHYVKYVKTDATTVKLQSYAKATCDGAAKGTEETITSVGTCLDSANNKNSYKYTWGTNVVDGSNPNYWYVHEWSGAKCKVATKLIKSTHIALDECLETGNGRSVKYVDTGVHSYIDQYEYENTDCSGTPSSTKDGYLDATKCMNEKTEECFGTGDNKYCEARSQIVKHGKALGTSYGVSCADPSSWNPTAMAGPNFNGGTMSCATLFQTFSVNGYALSGIDFKTGMACSELSTVPWNTLNAATIINSVGETCCTGGSVCTKEYAKICNDPNKYTGSRVTSKFGNAEECNSLVYMVYEQKFGYIDWTEVSECADFSSTPADDGHTGQQWARYIAEECCSDGKSICHNDFSKLCEDPSEYDKDAKWDKYGNSPSCGHMLTNNLEHVIQKANLIIENVDTNTCDDYIIETGDGRKVNLLQHMEQSSECCGAKGAAKNGCLPDYSKICKTPGNYDGEKSVTIGHNTLNCDTAIQHGMYQHLDFATLKCDDFSNNHDLEVLLAPSCCSDGKSLCWRDYSKLCEDPSKYDKDAKWDRHDPRHNMNVCGKFLTSHIRQAIEKENLIIEDVDSNTCDDYLIESGYVYGGGENTGEKINLLRYMEFNSECCGTKGMAKDGCPKNHGPPAILVVIVCICFCTIFVGIGIAVKHKYKKKNDRGGITVVQNGGIEMFQPTTTSSNQYVIANNNNNNNMILVNGQVAQPVAMQYRQQQLPVYQHVSSQLSVGTSNNEAFAQVQDELGAQVTLIPHQQNATSSNVGTILPQPIEISPYKITKSKT